MTEGQQMGALRILLGLMGLGILTLGILHVLSALDLALLLAICVLLWQGLLRGRESAGPAEANEKFWTIFNGTSDAVFLRPDTQFMGTTPFTEANDMACQRLGYSRDEFRRMTPWDIEELQEGRKLEDMRGLIKEQGHVLFESAVRTKSGEVYPAEVHIHAVRLGGKPVILSMIRDITARKHLEHQLRHSQKLEAVGQLAGGVAHDFNNILQVINGYGTLVQMTMPERDPNSKAVAEILKASERAAHLTHSLLAFSRKQIMNPKNVDLNALVSNVHKFLGRIIGEDIHLNIQLAPDPQMVLVDVGQIEQVLMNLATNARAAMPGGGSLSISTELVEAGGPAGPAGPAEHCVELRSFGAIGRFALLTVTDDGAGMDQATQKRIFDPFFTTKAMGRGTGLGLSIVYGIIKQHGGYITVTSHQGVGTTFSLYLPTVEASPSQSPEDARLQSRVKGTETVLVAEDEPDVRSLVAMVLEKHGYNVILAQDGQEAVTQFQAHRRDIKLILMDIIMPRKGGRQAYEEIRRTDPNIQVLFISGYTADFIKSRGDLTHGMELIMKPVQPLDLLRKIREMLDAGVCS